MITNLTLKNFKQHEHVNIDFSNGVNTITGENFAGKSSLLHGLLYAWWGALAVPGGQKLVQKRGTSGHSAEVTWVEGGDTYHIKRTSSLCNLWKNGKEEEHLVATSSSAVGVKLTELFGMDRSEFCDIKYAEQKRAEQMLTLGAARVHSLIEKIVDAERVNNVIEKTKSEVSRLGIQLETIPSYNIPELLEAKQSFDTSLEGSKVTLQEVTVQHDTAQAQLVEASEQLQELKTKSALVVQSVRQYEQLSRELDSAAEQLGIARAKLDSRPQLSTKESVDSAIAVLKEKIEKSEAALLLWNRYEQDSGSAKATLDHCANGLKVYTEAVEKLPVIPEGVPSEDEVYQRINKVKIQVEQERDKAAVARSHLAHLRSGEKDAVCHTCNRALEGADVDNIKVQVADQEKVLSALLTSMEVLHKELEELDSLANQYSDTASAKAALQTVEAEYVAAKEQYEQIEAPTVSQPSQILVAQDKSTLEKLQQEERDIALEGITKEHLAAEISRTTELQTALSVRITKLVEESGLTPAQLQNGAADTYKEETSAVQSKVYNLDELVRKHAQVISRCREEAATLTEKLNSITEKILLAKETEDSKKAMVVRRDACKRLNKFLRDNKDTFLAEIWSKVMRYATSVAQTCTGGKISEVNRTSDGKFEYWEDGEVFPVEAASGAQRSIMGLGVQLALSEMLPSAFDALLLDEPTADMSETVSMSLAALLSKSGSQVLMVSHREMDGTVSDNSIHL